MNGMAVVVLFVAALFAGALNSVAGGGSFISFPALLFTGVPDVVANATNTVAVWPAGVASAFAYRKDMKQPLPTLLSLGTASLLGGWVGAHLLLRTSDAQFESLLPWLLLVATLVFTFGGKVSARLLSGKKDGGKVALGPSLRSLVLGGAFQLVIGIYGGYFGGGMGILMLATLAMMGMSNIHAMNGLKTLLGTLINGIAVVEFVRADKVTWGPGVVMIIGASIGGYAGAALARKVEPARVKRFVMVVAWGMTALFFARAHGLIRI
jgi:uncharacterized membrane protein YfcA